MKVLATSTESRKESLNEELSNVLSESITADNQEKELNLESFTNTSDDEVIRLDSENFSLNFQLLGVRFRRYNSKTI